MKNKIIDITSESDLPESLQDVFRVWDNLPKLDKGPLASAFTLESIPHRILPWSVLVDVLDEPNEYRFRFWGTERVNLIGEEMTGKRLAQITDPYMRKGNEVEYNYVRENGHAVLCHTPFTTPSGLSSIRFSIRLPLTDKTGEVSMIFSAMNPDTVTESDYQYYGTSPRATF